MVSKECKVVNVQMLMNFFTPIMTPRVSLFI